MRVLFVDDSIDNLTLYKLYFKKMTEIEIDYFADPREGLTHALNDKYDLIFLDIQMPEIDGFEFKAKLDESKIVATICALTGFTDESTLEKIESHNFSEIIKKPILKKDLVELVEKYKK
ncbi:response regulator [Bacteriovorax sp. Seq25_V]|uniref:response regulator n=1 Tax=Bacteriovorax sp. Seq25_V TaxID=1201288 RepID=UPI00038A23F1|nr:response regulator [Bacteriovorax sp. Seq25_V]EQC43901.1 response regulator receiver domain protein [Bacteriovorax sp. Seq25_V]